MKKLSLALLSCFAFVIIRAQAPAIGEGTVLEYSIMPNGTFLTASLRIEKLSADTLLMSWQLNLRSGRRGMLRKSMETAKRGYWEPPMDGEDFMIPEDQSLLSISKSCFTELKQNGRMEFDGLVFTKSTDPVKYDLSGGVKVNAFSATSENGYTRIWVLDNPDLPLILKLDGNPFQVDIEITGIK
jgi:hypothetical protein